MSKIQTLEDLLKHEIGDLMSAEKQITKALPKLAKKCTEKKLSQALETHLKETEKQIERLEKIVEELGIKSSEMKTCKAMQGLLEEGDEITKEIPEGSVLDAAIIGACQRVEHYEMAGYGTARAFAQLLGLKNVVKLLSQTYEEEVGADKKLSSLAESMVNEEAMAE